MSDLNTFVLPEHDDMLRRLLSVEDEPHMVERFYPLILKYAGQKRAGGGIVMMFALAIADYTKPLPPRWLACCICASETSSRRSSTTRTRATRRSKGSSNSATEPRSSTGYAGQPPCQGQRKQYPNGYAPLHLAGCYLFCNIQRIFAIRLASSSTL